MAGYVEIVYGLTDHSPQNATPERLLAFPDLGQVVPFGAPEALAEASAAALERAWDREAILRYARDNDWSRRVETLDREFGRLADRVDVQ